MTAVMKKEFQFFSCVKDMLMYGSIYLIAIVLIEYISLGQGSSFIVKLMDSFFYGTILVTLSIIGILVIKNYKTVQVEK